MVLCYFEGLSLAEAASRLRCPAGTVHSRLVRAREKLRLGLIRRGVALSTTAMAAALAPRSASASIPPLLCDSTTRAAIAFAARHAAAGGALAAPASALAQEVLRTMLLHKLKLTAMSLLLLAAVATGAGWLARSMAMKDEPVKEPAAPKAADSPIGPTATTAKPDPAATARMTVAGRVLDPDGKPVKGAVVDLITRPRSPWVAASDDGDRHDLLGQAQADADGRFQLDSPRTGSSRVFEVYAVAAAPGYGLGWVELNPDAEKPVAEIRLQPEQAVRVRLVDVTGSPARGVEVAVDGVGSRDDKGEYHGVPVGPHPPKGLRVWPRPAHTDDQGRATFSGIGRGSAVSLSVSDLRYVRQSLCVDPARIPASGGDDPRPPAVAAHRGPRPRRRHRPADPQRRGLGLGHGQE